jgi:hypothetical protein
MEGRALFALPPSLVDLLRNGEGIVYVDAEIPHSALYLWKAFRGWTLDEAKREALAWKQLS